MAKGLTMEGKISIENRRYPRRQIQLPVLYAPLNSGELPKVKKTFIEDFGAGGVAMNTEHPLKINQLLTINLYLPPIAFGPTKNDNLDLNQCEPVTLLVRVAWSRKIKNYQGYNNGLAFQDIDVENSKRLKHFLVDYELDQITLS